MNPYHLAETKEIGRERAGVRNPSELEGKIATRLRDGRWGRTERKDGTARSGTLCPLCRSAIYSAAGVVVHATPL